MSKNTSKSENNYSQYSVSVNSGEKQKFNLIPQKGLTESTKDSDKNPKPSNHTWQQLQFDINIDPYDTSHTGSIRKPIIIDNTAHPKSVPLSKSPSIPIKTSTKSFLKHNHKALDIVEQKNDNQEITSSDDEKSNFSGEVFIFDMED